MADIKFSEFPKANQSKDTDELAILQDGVNKMIASPVLESKIINKTVSRVIDQGGASLNVINLKGVVPTYSDLSLITPTPELNDAYQVESDGLVYVYTENGFQAEGDGFVVQAEPNGVVEEGNTQAVSGNEVFLETSTLMPKSYFETFPKSKGSEIVTDIGKFIRPNGTTDTNTNYSITTLQEIPAGAKKIRIKTNIGSLAASPLVFFDNSQVFLSGITLSVIGLSDVIYDVPNNAKYFKSTSNTDAISIFEVGYPVISVITNDIVDSKIEGNTKVDVKGVFDTSIFTNVGFIRPDGTKSTNSAYSYSDLIDISEYYNLNLHTAVGAVSVSPAVFYDENENYISGVTPTVTTATDYNLTFPANAKYIATSIQNTSKPIFLASGTKLIKNVTINNDIPVVKADRIYISPDGLDTNSGIGRAEPIKTFEKAIELLSPLGELVFLEGDYWDFQMNLSQFSNITGAGNGVGNVRISQGVRITSATATAGTTRVFQTENTTSLTGRLYLWQHDIDDEMTVILDEERHPIHRGRRTRLPSTRIYPASSIAEIESTTDRLMWFKEGNILYFSKVTGSDLSVNPIVIPNGTYLFSGGLMKNVGIRNINFIYSGVLTQYLTGIFENVSCGMFNGTGAFRYDNTTGLTFRNCEGYGCSNDGFNGTNSYPTFGRTSVTFENCYGHDNFDDGESCHGYSDIIHNGGLYEYNGNGITPASGGHAICYNVIVRRSGGHTWSTSNEGTGFSAQGVSLDDGIGTNLYCYSCISENNVIGFRGLADNGSKAYNCISKGDTTPFTNVEQVNCVTL